MAVSRKALREALKNQYMEQLIQMLAGQEDVGMVGTNEFNFPVVDSEGNEDFIVVKISIPTGTREGDAYDGYAMRDEYQAKVAEKAAKAKAAAEAKAKKIARDKANREKLAMSKAAHTKA